MTAPDAVVLIGPTGSGKTPLGDLLERQGLQRRGLRRRRCLHFDFGRELRRAAAGPAGTKLTAREVAVVEAVLRDGALLEDEHFPIAAKVLDAFLAQRGAAADDLVVLNGLPRHPGQARDLEAIIRVRAVVELACGPDTVLHRIRADAGGDRAGRSDDDEQAIRNRLAVYAQRTAILLDHYRAEDVAIITIPVGPQTTAEDALDLLSRRWP